MYSVRRGKPEGRDRRSADRPVPASRVWLRRGIVLAVAALTALVIVPQVTQLGEIARALQSAQWGWLLAAVLASAFTYPMAAVQLIGAAAVALPLGRTTLAQVASAVGNLVAPGGLGGAGVNVRYLDRCGMAPAESVAVVTLANGAGFITHVLLLIVVGGAVASAGISAGQFPARWVVLALVIGVALIAGAAFWSESARGRLTAAVSQVARRLLGAVQRPRQAMLLMAGSLGITAGYVLALWFSLRAFGAQPSFANVTVAFLVCAAVGTASPTPGGLGAVEAALTGAMIRFGVAGGTAVVAVVAFRLVTYWLPCLPGAVAFRMLRRQGSL